MRNKVFMRRILCVILLAAGAAPVAAQTLPTVPNPPAAVAEPLPTLTRADTARAVHELFRSRRGGGAGWLALGTVGILASTLPALQTTSAGVWSPGVVAGSAFTLIGLNKRIQFRRGREKQVLRELAATGHLPASVSRRLRGNFLPLHGTATADNPLLAAGIQPVAPASAGAPAPAATNTPAPATTGVPIPPSPAQALADARQDTLDAVQGMFNAKRLGGQLPMLVALPALRLMTGASGSSSSTPPGQGQQDEASPEMVAAGLLLAAGGLTYMFVHNAPYSDAKFSALRTSYLAGQPLPATIRTKLKPKHMADGRTYRERMERRAARRRR
ncbi:hypothetical protein LJY25_14135 [Hymenobacter sp. BT175]|uniref:hypothetical protein n=1 Tax=Hymenobacter translucens TaxID=2886507 RepID=UPI001D0E6436|nr:hypothetical protein [Hymenobacter translucens]MCC2547592.1 hypothetical protein [Hymenobacter translucens]